MLESGDFVIVKNKSQLLNSLTLNSREIAFFFERDQIRNNPEIPFGMNRDMINRYNDVYKVNYIEGERVHLLNCDGMHSWAEWMLVKVDRDDV